MIHQKSARSTVKGLGPHKQVVHQDQYVRLYELRRESSPSVQYKIHPATSRPIEMD